MERILCAAIWFQDDVIRQDQPKNIEIGIVILGFRHSNCYETWFELTRKRDISCTHIQGFLTSDNKFFNRKDSWRIALGAGQVTGKSEEELISEDLY